MFRIKHRSGMALLVLALASCAAGPVLAQGVGYQEEYAKLIKADQEVAPLTDGMFGDSVSLYNGSTQFVQTDVSLPGNSALPVAFSRRFAVENRGGGGLTSNRYALGDWDVEVPYISAVHVQGGGWTVELPTGVSTLRCSGPQTAGQASPPDGIGSGGVNIPAHEYWQAPALHIPGGGGNPLLFLTSATLPRPSDGRIYRWLTKDNWFLACTSTITGDTGEGFIARSPDGLIYHFNHMVKLAHAPVVRKTGATASRSIAREEVRLYATKVEDRFIHGSAAKPNSVSYAWTGSQLQSISGSDGRLLTLSYGANGKISSVSDQTRLWVYNYTTDGYDTLSSVILPDTTLWEFGLAPLQSGATSYDPNSREAIYVGPYCNKQRELPASGTLNLRSGTIRHPSGALATFTFDIRRHGRTEVPLICDEIGTDERFFSGQYPVQFDTLALVTKTITSPNLPIYTWNYDYQITSGSNCVPGQGCPVGDSSKSVSVTAPDGSRTTSIFGVRFGSNEGMLLGTRVYPTAAATTPLREQSLAYLTPAEAASFQIPAAMGEVLNPRTDTLSSATTLPQKLRQTMQEGSTFTWQATAFDTFARPTRVQRSSTLSLGAAKTESTAYHDNYLHWVLGQVATVTHVVDATTSVTMAQNTYDLATAQLLSESSWGKLRKSYVYAADGTLASVMDGAGASHATVLSDYYRGVPRRVDYANAGEYETAQVNNAGRITHVRDERNYTTEFVYHPNSGKLTQIRHPQGDTVAWNPTTFDLEKIVSGDMGFGGVARWRQTIRTGNRHKEIHFDALLRPVVTIEWDAAAPAAKRYDVRRYDHAGREVFRSMPLDSEPANFATVSAGISTSYDALGRVTSTTQTSELPGPGLTTSVSYLTGFRRSVLDPRNRTTTTTFLAWDEPTYDYPLQIQGPEGLTVLIMRDTWGNPTRVRRDATIDGVVTTASRRYLYDEHKRLCHISENESGTTIIDYDAADNVLWRATGLPGNLIATQCGRSTVASSAKTNFSYDLRNRLLSTTPPAGTVAVTQTYYPDGSLWTLASDGTVWTYEYNGRGLVEKETLNYDSRSFVFDWTYDTQASVAALTYPDGSQLAYAPDALGRPTMVGSYVSDARYHIDGALREFDYANGFKHTLTQNARHLPLQSKDVRNGVKIVDLNYSYDGNANVAGMVDGTSGALETKQLVYDGLNRLTGITNWPLYSPVSFEYDAFDNLRRLQVGSRVLRLAYDPVKNRPYALQSDAGVTQQALTYDARGNLQSKGTQSFTFDAMNRLTAATPVSGSGSETYVYDGHGRRVSILRTGQNRRYSVYTLDGKLRYEIGANGEVGKYAYLGNSLVARSGDAPAQISPPAIPAPLTSGEPYPSTDGVYTLNWSSVANVVRYDLEETVPGGAVTVMDRGLATSWTTSAARPAGNYGYRARACNAAGCSAWTGTYGIRVQYSSPPAAPNPLIASPNPSTTGAFSVSWASVGAASYRLEETTGGTVVVRYSGGGNSWPASGRAIGSYGFVVYACNANNECTASFPLTVSVQEDTSVPVPPSSIWASPEPSTTGLYTVQWTAAAGADHYKLYEEANGIEQGVIYSGASTSWSIAPATPRATGDYRYWVKACKTLTSGATVCSTDSSAFTEHVRLPGVPATPAWISLSPAAGNNQIACNGTSPRSFTLYWAASSGAVHHYEVIESNHVNSNSPIVTVPPPPPATLPSLSLSRSKIPPDSYTTYQYEVRACNEAGGDAGCSGWRGVAEMCVGNSGGNGPFRVASTTYYHTDALGSSVATTNANGSLDKFSRYEPYGLPADGTFPDSPGYTGHVADSFTQLSYMQQRYYDPMMGRFLSVDPVSTEPDSGDMFNRYSYANNSPYRFIDPDGRQAGCDYGSITCKSPGAEAFMADSARQDDTNDIENCLTAGCANSALRDSAAAVAQGASDAADVVDEQAVDTVKYAWTGAAGKVKSVIFGVFRWGSRAKSFEKAGIATTTHFRNRLATRGARGVTEENALDAYQNGRLYYNNVTQNYIRHSSRTGVSVVTDAPSGGKAITVFEGSPSPDWVPVPWRPG